MVDLNGLLLSVGISHRSVARSKQQLPVRSKVNGLGCERTDDTEEEWKEPSDSGLRSRTGVDAERLCCDNRAAERDPLRETVAFKTVEPSTVT
jgi:hypothetical protein